MMFLRSDVVAVCNLKGTFSMSVSCSRWLVSLSIGRVSADKSQSQLPKLCLRLASSMVMIWDKISRCKSEHNNTLCVCVFCRVFMPFLPPSYKRQDRQRSCQSCPVHPQQQILVPEPPFRTHLETTGRKRSTDGPLWNKHKEHWKRAANSLETYVDLIIYW